MIAKCKIDECIQRETCKRYRNDSLEGQEYLNSIPGEYLSGTCYWYIPLVRGGLDEHR